MIRSVRQHSSRSFRSGIALCFREQEQIAQLNKIEQFVLVHNRITTATPSDKDFTYLIAICALYFLH